MYHSEFLQSKLKIGNMLIYTLNKLYTLYMNIHVHMNIMRMILSYFDLTTHFYTLFLIKN